MRIRFGNLVALGGLFALYACGGSSDDDLGGGGVPLSELPDRLAHAACTAVESCWGNLLTPILNGEDCVERTKNSIGDTLSTLETATKAGTAKYDGNKANACISLVEKAGCDVESAFESATCRDALDGTAEVGGNCTSDVDCKGAAYCKSSGACPGTCTEPGAVGTPCDYHNQCADGLKCDKDKKSCFQPAAEGSTCGGGTGPECAEGMFCVGQDEKTGKTGTCKTFADLFSAAAGAACDPINGPLCAGDSRCVVQSLGAGGLVAKCEASVTSGAPCKLSFLDECPSGEYCDVVPDTIDGKCKALPKSGEPCAKTVLGDEMCAAYLRCDGGTCKPLQSLGGACVDDATCYSESCTGGKCIAPGGCS